MPPKIEFFDDRIEITSFGSLPQGMNEREFFDSYSVPRNKELMRVFKDLDLVEHLGSDVPRILESYGKECFKFTENFVRMTFPVTEQVTEQVKRSSNQAINHIFNSLDDIIVYSNGVSNGAKEIISKEVHDKVEYILQSLIIPKKRSDLFKCIALSNQSINRKKYLDKLIDIGWIAKEFPDKINNPTQRYFTTLSGN